MEGWSTKKLEEVVDLKRGFDLPTHSRRPGPYPVLSSGVTAGWHDEGPIKGPGLVIGRATNLGQPTWSSGDFWPLNTTLYAADFHGNVTRWVFHLFESMDLTGFDSGSVQPMLNRNYIAQLPVLVPPVSEQRAIAEVLGALDDKIAANTKLADTAHALLQAAYQGLTIPQGSASVRVEALVQRLTPKRKFVPDELKPSGDFPVFDQSESGFLGYLDGEGYLKASPDEPVLYFGDHTCQLRISSEKFTVGPNTVPFTGVGIPSLALYCALSGLQRHEEYKRHWQLLMKKEVRLPDEATVNTFSRIHTPLLTVFKETREQNRTLAATRDTLLPQLMSGKLRVRDIEHTVGEMV